MRLLAALLLAAVAASSYAEESEERNGDNGGNVKQLQVALQKARAQAASHAEGTASIVGGTEADNAAIAPNPSAPAPSAQCRFGWSVTGAVIDFGAGITGSEWDEICGLWLAAQQTTGTAKNEAAAAAFCLTMKKAKVKSPTCDTWDQGQMVVKVEMNDNQAEIVFGGAGTGGRD